MNRYRSDLSDGGDADLDREVRPGRGARIPDLPARSVERLEELPLFSVEKIHPLFYQFDSARLLDGLERASKLGAIRMVYRLRDPEHAVRSLIRYKLRNPRWYRLELEDAAAYCSRTLQSLALVHQEVPGFVSTYERHRHAPSEHVESILSWLWPGHDHRVASQGMEEAASRKRRVGTTLFMADSTSEDAPVDEIVEELVASMRDAIVECQALTESITVD